MIMGDSHFKTEVKFADTSAVHTHSLIGNILCDKQYHCIYSSNLIKQNSLTILAKIHITLNSYSDSGSGSIKNSCKL